LEDAYAKKKQRPEAADDWKSTKPKTELGKSMLEYLLQKEKSAKGAAATASSLTAYNNIVTASSQVKVNPTIQKSIQRSVLTFSLKSDVRQRKNAWEVPRMSVRAFGAHDGDAAGMRMTPLNHHMIATITKKLGEGKGRAKETEKYQACGRAEEKIPEAGKQNEDGGDTDIKNGNTTNVKANGNNGVSTKDDDSDDDIFQDAGSYVPQVLAPKASLPETEVNGNGRKRDDTEDKPKQAKQSIFDNLIPEIAPEPPKRVQQQSLQHRQQPMQNKNVIDRDILGGKQNDSSYQKRRGPQSAAMEGVSMTAYQGGYGEEMDVDYANNDEDEWRKRKKGDKDNKGDSGNEAGGQDEDDEEG